MSFEEIDFFPNEFDFDNQGLLAIGENSSGWDKVIERDVADHEKDDFICDQDEYMESENVRSYPNGQLLLSFERRQSSIAAQNPNNENVFSEEAQPGSTAETPEEGCGRIAKAGKKYKLLLATCPWANNFYFSKELIKLLRPEEAELLISRLEEPKEEWKFLKKLKQNCIAFYSNPFKKWLKKKGKLGHFNSQLDSCKIKSPSRWMYASMAELVLIGEAEQFQVDLYEELKQFLNAVFEDDFVEIDFKRKSRDLCLYTWVSLKALLLNPWAHLSQHKTEEILLSDLRNNRKACKK